MLCKSQKQPPEVFCKKRCSEKFRKITLKIPVLESLFNKVAGLKTCNFIKKRQRCFPVEFAKFLRTPILKNSCERLLLSRVFINLTFFHKSGNGAFKTSKNAVTLENLLKT